MRLQGKTAVVTGGAKGIGLACVERLAAEGAHVVFGDVAIEEGAKVAARLSASGHPVRFLTTDVRSRLEVDALVGLACDTFGSIDIMVNNAGLARSAPFLSMTEEDLDFVLSVNLRGVFHGAQAAARRMVAQGGGGVIVNMSSVNALLAIPGQLPYAISKGGVNQLTRVLAVELAEHDIRVVAVGPGTIMTDQARGILADRESLRRAKMRTPMRRFGEPAEVASVVAFLASQDASYITGQTVYMDGGRLVLNYVVPTDD